jgi:hypothetical protein
MSCSRNDRTSGAVSCARVIIMSMSAHSSTRMLERCTHASVERKRAALETFDSVATN